MSSPSSCTTQTPTTPTTIQSSYTTLIQALHPSSPSVLELDILPSTYPPQLHISASSLALPKTLLIPLYLHARRIFFAYLSSPSGGDNSNSRNKKGREEAYKATTVLLLWDPNHLTAANFRKRWIRDIADTEPGTGVPVDSSGNEDGNGKEVVREAVERELRFLETLTASPLKKHTKSPTLWAQREWLVRTFWSYAIYTHINNNDDEREEAAGGSKETVKTFWNEELDIVMRAGERHPRNYYAWGYARVVWRRVGEEMIRGGEGEREGLFGETLEKVKGWCFLHPRDISGWGFLMFLIREGEGEGEGMMDRREEVIRAVRETREWVRKFEWKGESVEWFLKGVDQLGIET